MKLFSALLIGALSVIPCLKASGQQEAVPTQGPAENGSPAWHLQSSFPDPGGQTLVDAQGHVTITRRPGTAGFGLGACSEDIAKLCNGQTGMQARKCLTENHDSVSAECKAALDQAASIMEQAGNVPNCSHSPVCDNKMRNGVGPMNRQELQRVEWQNNLGYKFTYPYALPEGPGGVPAVGLDSKGNLWVFKRSPAGTPQLYKFGPDHKLILSVGDDVIGHQEKAHGMAVDGEDNVWICDANAATVTEVSPEGKRLMVLGEHNHRGDWVEEKGQRLLWQPVMVAFAPNGDMYIAEGHGNESPDDTDSNDPTNVSGAARILHLDKNGKYINQWYGDKPGPGKFYNAHGIAIDPKNGDVWIGDREDYRIVVYTANGQFLKTFAMRNLVCALHFDPQGNPWMGSGQDGQFLKLNHDGKVVGAVGNGMGIGVGQFIEASYFVFDKHDDIYAGDTSVGRVTVMVAPKTAAHND